MSAFTNNKPLVINWMISGKCNMPCKFCYGRFDSYIMPKNDKLSILNQVIKYKIPKLTLTGGEPLLDVDIRDILKTAHASNIFTSLHTNGLLLDENLINKIKNYVGRISLSLDGSSNEMNLIMRGEINYLSRITGIIKTLKRENISFSIRTVASRKNLGDIQKMAALIVDFNPVVWLITEFKPLRRGEVYKNEFELNPGEFDILKTKLESLPLNICLFSNDDLSNHPHFFIDSKGDVYTNGPVSDYHIGHMFSDSIPILWKRIIDKNKVTQTYYDHSRITVNENNH